MNELSHSGDAYGAATATAQQFTILVEENDVMISRQKPTELVHALGFISWNKFCDRLDEALEPLRILAETSADDVFSARVSGGHKEQHAKTKSLERLQ